MGIQSERKLKNIPGPVSAVVSRVKELQNGSMRLEEKYRTIFDLMPSGIMVIDPHTHNIVYINQTLAGMFGESIDRIVGSICHNYVCPADKGKCPVTDLELTVDKADHILLRKDGISIPITRTIVCINLDGRDLLLESFSDISDLKKLQTELFDSEAKYHQILEEMEEAYYEIDSKGNLTFINEATARTYGYTREEMLGMSYKQFTPRENWSETVADYVRVFVSGVPQRHRAAVGIKKDGAISYREDSIFPVRNARGEIVGLRGISHDVTERKIAEEKLRAALASYHLVAEHTTDAVWMTDMNLNITYLSPSVQKMRGFTLKEIKEMPLEKNLTPESLKLAAETLFAELPRIEADPEYNPIISLELEFYRKDGTTLWTETKFSLIRDASGRVVSIVGEARDISERKKAEEALKKSEDTYRLLAEHINDVVWMMDLDLNVTWLSPSSEKVRGFSLDETIAMPLDKQLTPDSLGKAVHLLGKWMHIEKAGRTPEPDGTISTELEFTCKDGHSVLLECTFKFIRDEKGKSIGILAEGRDITARRAAERARDESEKNYRLLAENTSDVITIMDMDLNITWVSSSCEKLTGYTTEEQKSLPIDKQMTQESLDRALNELAAELDKEKSGSAAPDRHHDIELEIRHKDGHTLWTENRLQFIRDSQGEAVGLLMQGRDIIERKRTERSLQKTLKDLKRSNTELQRRNNQLYKVREIALGTNKSKTTGDVLRLVAERSRELLGVRFVIALKFNETRDKLVLMYYSRIRESDVAESPPVPGFNLADYMGKTSTDEKLEFASSQFKTVGELEKSTTPIIKKKLSQILQGPWPKAMCDSIQRALDIKSFIFVPMVLDEQKWGALVFILDGETPLDILEMISAHCSNALKNVIAYEAFFNAFDSNPTPSAITSFSDGKFIEVNESFLKVIDYKREDVLGRTARELKLWPDTDEHARIAPLIRKEHKVSDAEITFRNKSGHIRRGVFSAKIISINNQLCNLMTINDVTERRQMEDEIRSHRDHLAELEVSLRQAIIEANTANQAKSEFLARMSHEIRTPLHGVTGILDLLVDSKLDLQQQEYLALARSSADSLLSVISDILDFSKIEAGKFELESEEFDLESVVEASLNTVAVIAQKKGLEMIHQLSPGVPTILWGDPTHLRQILVNLLSNSVKFTEKGKILISVEKEIDENEGVVLHFCVKDTGIGIPKEKRDSIFDAFSQADSSVERRRGGTGLGLTISRSLVEKMGGRIWVESDVGNGSTFHFTIKFAKKIHTGQRQVVIEHPSATTDSRKLNILVAEDNSTSQLIAKKMLEKGGHVVTIAGNGAQACEKVANADFDVVFMDVEMPLMNGLKATKIIRGKEKKSGRHIPIVAMTAYATKEDKEKCLAAGMNDYLVKPVKSKDLYALIDKLFLEERKDTGNRDEEEKLVQSKTVDLEIALQTVGGDKGLLREALSIFIEQDYPEQLKRLKEGVESLDALKIKAAAHSIKGNARTFGGMVLGDISQYIEEKGRTGDLEGTPGLIDNLEAEFKQFTEFFLHWEI
ncbi:MAG: PAS domain S-box protein [Dehalococcoidia bacterium]|jgi:PAS domain S-box-containing protein